MLLIACLGFLYRKQSSNIPISTAAFLFFLSLIISVVFSDNPSNSLIHLYEYLSLIAIFYVVSISRQSDKNLLINILMMSAIVVSLYSLRTLFIFSDQVICYLDKYNKSFPFAQEFLARKRAFAPFSSPNLLAGYLLMMIMLSGGIIAQKIKEKKNDYLFFLGLICLFICLLALFFSKSIGAWVVFTASLLLFLIFAKMKSRKALLILCLIIIIFGAVLYLRFQETNNFVQPAFSFHKRISYWRDAVSLIKRYPLTGVGIGNFYVRGSVAAHNSYLQIWAEFGVLGIISSLLIFTLFIKKVFQFFHSGKLNYFRLGILLGGLSFLLHNVIDFSFFVSQVAFLWWVLLGLSQEESLCSN